MDKVTTSASQTTLPSDSEGTLRAKLQSRLSAARAELASQLLELRQASADGVSASLLAACDSQLSLLDGLQQGIATASGNALAILRSDIGAAVVGSTAVLNQARAAIASNTAADAGSVSSTGAALRKELNDLRSDIYDRHIFDDYLGFSSTEERDAYRRREAESRRYIVSGP